MGILSCSEQELKVVEDFLKRVEDSGYDPLLVEKAISLVYDVSAYIFLDPEIITADIRRALITHNGKRALKIWGGIRSGQKRHWIAVLRKLWEVGDDGFEY